MKNQDQISVVASRLGFLTGKLVTLRLSKFELAPEEPSAIQGTYIDCIPAGRAYFIRILTTDGKTKLIQTDDVSQISSDS